VLKYILILTIILASCKNAESYHQRTIVIDNNFTILKTGLPDADQSRAMNTMAEKYGFSFRQLGCTIPEEYWGRFHKHNDSVYSILSGCFGENWRNTFAREVNSMEQVQGEIISVIRTKPFIIKADSILNKAERRLCFQYHLTQIKDILVVNVYSYQRKDNESYVVPYYKMIANAKTFAVDSI